MAQTPDLDPHGKPAEHRRPATPSASFNRNLDRSHRILFADASEVSRAVATLQLKHLGFSVDGVSEAASFVRALSSQRYRTILVADNIRLEPTFDFSCGTVRVFLLTHATTKPEELPSWADGALVKPLTLRILSQALGSPKAPRNPLSPLEKDSLPRKP